MKNTFTFRTGFISALLLGLGCLLLHSPAFANNATQKPRDNSFGTFSSEKRQDRIMGTFTEGMQLEKDEETGDTIMQSAPTPTDQPQEEQQTMPLHIEVTPKLPPIKQP